MKKSFFCVGFSLLLAAVLLLSCKRENNKFNYFHKVDPVDSISAYLGNGSRAFTTAQEKPYGNEITIAFPYFYPEGSESKVDVSKVRLSIVFNEQIKVTSDVPDMIDLTEPFVIHIVNADGSKEEVTIKASIRKSGNANIERFSLPDVGIVGAINGSSNEIGIDKKGKDLSNQVPNIVIPPGATISPDPSTPQNFNKPVEYRVTAQDGTVEKYTVIGLDELNNFEIHKGVNVASWLSTPKYDGLQRAAFFNESDVRLLSELGFDHIRLLVDEVVLWDDNGNKIRQYGFDLLHEAIDWCLKYGIRVIVDLHITRDHRFTNSENVLFTDPNAPARFVGLWEDLSDELSRYPNSLVAYELLNEPVSKDPENWNRVLSLAINAIRQKEPDRTIVVGVCTSSSAVRYNDLDIPSTHKILMTFHYYGPFLLTAYGLQSTTGGRTDIPINYPGQLVPDDWISELPEKWQATGQRYYDKERLATSILKGINTAKRLNVPVFVGEFGTINALPNPARSNWYRDVVDILEENHVPYTVFDYKGAGYSLVKDDRTVKYQGVIDILLGQ